MENKYFGYRRNASGAGRYTRAIQVGRLRFCGPGAGRVISSQRRYSEWALLVSTNMSP
jgi:hypothetical protein